MNIPLLDLKAQFQPLRAEIMAAVQTVCDEQDESRSASATCSATAPRLGRGLP